MQTDKFGSELSSKPQKEIPISGKARIEYRLIYATFSGNQTHIENFEKAVTDALSKGFKIQGEPFIVGDRIYQPMTRDAKGTAFAKASDFGTMA